MKKRFISGFFIVVIIALAFALRELNIYLFDVLIGAMTIVAAFEVGKLFKGAGKYNYTIVGMAYPVLSYGLLLLGFLKKFTLVKHLIAQMLLIVIAAIVIFVVQLILKKKIVYAKKVANYQGSLTSFMFKSMMDTVVTFVYPSVFCMTLILISHIGEFTDLANMANYAGVNIGLIVLLATIISSCMSDVFALFVGTIIGGKKLAPRISPNKTIAGALGGILGSLLSMVIFFIVLKSFNDISVAFKAAEITVWTFLIYGLIASVISQAGDLFESYLKRKANAKDSGAIFPGHGGVMDRLDSISINALFTLIFFILVL